MLVHHRQSLAQEKQDGFHTRKEQIWPLLYEVDAILPVFQVRVSLETEHPSHSPEPTHLSQSASPAVKPEHWGFSLENSSTVTSFALKEKEIKHVPQAGHHWTRWAQMSQATGAAESTGGAQSTLTHIHVRVTEASRQTVLEVLSALQAAEAFVAER